MNYIDPTGHFFGAIVGGLVGGFSGWVNAVNNNENRTAGFWGGFFSGFVSGLAVDAVIAGGPLTWLGVGIVFGSGFLGEAVNYSANQLANGKKIDLKELLINATSNGIANIAALGIAGKFSSHGRLSTKGIAQVAEVKLRLTNSTATYFHFNNHNIRRIVKDFTINAVASVDTGFFKDFTAEMLGDQLSAKYPWATRRMGYMDDLDDVYKRNAGKITGPMPGNYRWL